MNKSDTVAIIRSLLSSTNSSYSLYNLNKDFKNVTGVDIPLFGYGNISDFLNSIPDTVKVTGVYPKQQITLVTNEKSAHIVSLVKRQKKNGARNKFFSRRKLSREIEIDTSFGTEESNESMMVLEKAAPNDLKGKTCPCFYDSFISLRNLSQIEESIPTIDVRVHTQIGEYAEVYPCWIFSPDKFYFRFRKFKRKFQDFTEKLQMFYTAHEEIPYVADDMVKPRQPCAVFYKISSKAMWHRAEIQEINRSSIVTVNFVDYGNSAEISKENVKYLDKNFQLFPQQAILGSLANIKPLRDQSNWSNESIKRFHDLAFEKDLVGGVVYINDKDNCMGMALSCTGRSEIHINDTLVKEGHAEFDINVWECGDFGEVLNKGSLYKTAPKPNIQSPVCFFTNDYCNNVRLRKMFSVVEEK